MDVTTNGLASPLPLAAAPPDELARIEQAYRELQRRDGTAEERAWRWERFAVLLGLVWLLTLGCAVWHVWHTAPVQAFVQVVQVDEQQRVVQLGIPQALLAYAPPDAVYMDMLGEWIRRVRWREEDSTHAKAQWTWVYRHTCAQARRFVQALEEREHPFTPGKKLVSVELKSITKTAAPASYQALWAEMSTDRAAPLVRTTLWSGTFSVARLSPATLTDAMDNRLGLCVAAFDLAQTPEGR